LCRSNPLRHGAGAEDFGELAGLCCAWRLLERHPAEDLSVQRGCA
jgi:hypothetical protein